MKLLAFDDAGAAIPCPATGGVSAIPDNALSAFDGENTLGNWTLTVDDVFAGDGGTLNSWGLNIISTAAAMMSGPPGSVGGPIGPWALVLMSLILGALGFRAQQKRA